MGMDLVLANTVVFRCVRRVGGVPQIDADDELRQVGIASPDHLHSLVNVICNDPLRGVPHENYSLDPNFFRELTVATHVGSLSEIVAENADPARESQ